MRPFFFSVNVHVLQTAVEKDSRRLNDRRTTVEDQIISGPIAQESFTEKKCTSRVPFGWCEYGYEELGLLILVDSAN